MKGKFFITTNGSSGISRETIEAAVETIKEELEYLLENNANEVIDVEIPSDETQIRVIDFYTLD